ncbi:SRPBCC family protein [Asanoa iriomotensis]|uniref:Activator of HSP90 ATPase n=1 Tax=Asanoa iriomotensis TaxID=234613 RepID=A0ABQ4BUH2_9ACTN|nr:SRPBCC domain-containing protein [Asanoa iriomotensis]GIF54181.1 activator of HSP90 ATPase [Asanoa iriomotensis]
MVDILHRVGVVAPLDDVYTAVATPEGIAAWWTTDTVGKSEVGETLALRFGEAGGFDLEVRELDPAGHVRWRVVEGPAEWIGTDIDWRLDRRGDYTIVLFGHEGWREPVEFMHHCSTKWATFLLSLKDYAETGRGRPAPDDVKISDWH